LPIQSHLSPRLMIVEPAGKTGRFRTPFPRTIFLPETHAGLKARKRRVSQPWTEFFSLLLKTSRRVGGIATPENVQLRPEQRPQTSNLPPPKNLPCSEQASRINQKETP
jgi:hypothetical protein